MEVPVSLDGKRKFVDPFTWIEKDFPTIVPCSQVTVHWKISGKWYCTTPEIRPCTAPIQVGNTLNCTLEGDFAMGLG